LYVRGWLKAVFLGKSALAAVISGMLVYNNVPGVGEVEVDLSLQFLGV